MATYFIGKNVGAGISPSAILAQATTTSRDVEVALNTTANVPNREALLLELQAIFDYVASNNQGW
jgi:hypothetical protein